MTRGGAANAAGAILLAGVMTACGGSSAMEEPPPRPVLDPVTVTETPRPSSAPACERTDATLGAAARLPSGSSEYRLVMVRGDATSRPAWVAGRLSLEPRPADLRRVREWTAPLQGTTDIDMARVGAYQAGALDSDDPRAPGVLVLRLDGAEPTLLLRLGAAANRTDETAFDAAFTVLTVRAIDDGGFSGSWRSGSYGDELRGYFCAVAATP